MPCGCDFRKTKIFMFLFLYQILVLFMRFPLCFSSKVYPRLLRLTLRGYILYLLLFIVRLESHFLSLFHHKFECCIMFIRDYTI